MLPGLPALLVDREEAGDEWASDVAMEVARAERLRLAAATRCAASLFALPCTPGPIVIRAAAEAGWVGVGAAAGDGAGAGAGAGAWVGTGAGAGLSQSSGATAPCALGCSPSGNGGGLCRPTAECKPRCAAVAYDG